MKSFSPLGKVLFTWGQLEVVVEHVVASREIILNDLMTYAHIWGTDPTPMSFFFKAPGV